MAPVHTNTGAKIETTAKNAAAKPEHKKVACCCSIPGCKDRTIAFFEHGDARCQFITFPKLTPIMETKPESKGTRRRQHLIKRWKWFLGLDHSTVQANTDPRLSSQEVRPTRHTKPPPKRPVMHVALHHFHPYIVTRIASGDTLRLPETIAKADIQRHVEDYDTKGYSNIDLDPTDVRKLTFIPTPSYLAEDVKSDLATADHKVFLERLINDTCIEPRASRRRRLSDGDDDLGLEKVGAVIDGKDFHTETVRKESMGVVKEAMYSSKIGGSAFRTITWSLHYGLID